MKRFGLIILSLLFFFGGCEKTEEYSEVPEIKFLSFDAIEGDGEYTIAKGILTFSFVDGDGNMGFFGNDTAENPTIDILIQEYSKSDNEFTPCFLHEFWMPYFEEGIYRKSLKGDIDIYLPRTILSPDTVYYEFYILDRANHKSNTEITPEIIYSELLKQ